jgi:hypothetical protein
VDKQEAIDFVLDELDKGRSLQEITLVLQHKLNAPVDLVDRFVRQTAERYEQSKAYIQPAPVSPHVPTAPSQPVNSYSPLPLDTRLPPAPYSPQYTAYGPPSAVASWQPASYQEPVEEIVANEPIPEPEQNVDRTSDMAVPHENLESNATVELENYILVELGKDKRPGDIALGVVEQSGMNYRQAQRLVSRVSARDSKKVASKQNRLIIPLALLFLMAGLVLLGASILEGYQLRFILNSPNNLSGEQIQQAYAAGQDLPWAFITGLALSLGGGIGLFAALRKQME